jgi:hypothetical protein
MNHHHPELIFSDGNKYNMKLSVDRPPEINFFVDGSGNSETPKNITAPKKITAPKNIAAPKKITSAKKINQKSY